VNFGRRSQKYSEYSSRSDKDVSGFKEVVLVAWNEEGDRRVCLYLFGLSEIKD